MCHISMRDKRAAPTRSRWRGQGIIPEIERWTTADLLVLLAARLMLDVLESRRVRLAFAGILAAAVMALCRSHR